MPPCTEVLVFLVFLKESYRDGDFLQVKRAAQLRSRSRLKINATVNAKQRSDANCRNALRRVKSFPLNCDTRLIKRPYVLLLMFYFYARKQLLLVLTILGLHRFLCFIKVKLSVKVKLFVSSLCVRYVQFCLQRPSPK